MNSPHFLATIGYLWETFLFMLVVGLGMVIGGGSVLFYLRRKNPNPSR